MSQANTKYAAFLRGINVGGNKKVPMADLTQVFESLKFKNVKTLLASGNVLFETATKDHTKLAVSIEKKLESRFGFEVSVIVRAVADLEKLQKSNPFKGVRVTPKIRLYVTFFDDAPKTTLTAPYISPDTSFRILNIKHGAICSVLDLTKSGTTDAMKILEKEFGKNITTRNWNTIEKMLTVSH